MPEEIGIEESVQQGWVKGRPHAFAGFRRRGFSGDVSSRGPGGGTGPGGSTQERATRPCIGPGFPPWLRSRLPIRWRRGGVLCEAAEQARARSWSDTTGDTIRSWRGEASRATRDPGSPRRRSRARLFYKPDGYFDERLARQPGGGPILINPSPRNRRPAHHLRRDCRCAGVHVQCRPRVSGGRHRRDQSAFCPTGHWVRFFSGHGRFAPKSWEQTSRENPSYATCRDEDCYVIAGTDGSLGVPTMRLKTYARPEGHSWWKPFQASVVGR